ncbi:hypothetical protein G7Y89_g3707 [Cudoniella acicularis]|uniref:Zn(2)-C6 fungal-type domain-containing protein n=1 Tax=Cudoniella acicularis TaxID=354080 RepID=A0A8H4RS44_9HELO|nr:hypothetical protein G7Y89_g3707 [Cudoniella acicularis]
MEDLIPEPTSQLAILPRKRRRPALSCAECRRRKVKCDRKDPCDQCRKTKSATCTYSPEGLSSLKNYVPQPISSHSLWSTRDVSSDGGKVLGEDLGGNVLGFSTAPENISDDTPSTSGQSISDSHSTASGQYVDQDLAQRVGGLKQVFSSVKINGQAAEIGNSRSLPARSLRGNMTKNRYFGHSHWMSALAQAKSFMCFEINLDDDDNPNDNDGMKLKNKEADAAINSAFDSCKMMARAIKATQTPQWTMWGVSFQHSMPVRSIADELVGHYLRTHEAIHRILHIPSFQKEYAQYWANPQATSTVSLIKILLVMAIGTCFYQGPDFDTHKTQAIHWVYTAQFWLASPREKSRLHIASIQVECLLLLARSIYNIGADILWNHTGSVLRTAMGMGFHRDPKYFKRYSILHNEVRRRLWATILEINIQACLDSGMSPMISINDFDTEAPSNINDNEIDESTATHPTSHPTHVFTQSSLQIALLSSLTTRLEAANLVNDYRVEISYEEVLRLDKELLRNYKYNHSFFTRAAQDPLARLRPTTFHRKILDLTVQRFLLVLHRPFAMKARNDPRFYYSHKIYLDTAMAVHTVPSNSVLDSNNCEVKDDYIRFRLISGGFLKEILIHSVIIIYQEMIAPLEDDLPGHDRSRIPALEAGETGVKSHLMYCIALAHIKALEQGTSSEEDMIEAAISSLRQSQEILKRRMPAALEDQFSGGIMAEIPAGDLDLDLSMQDWGMEFEPDDEWLFSGWPLGNAKGSAF